ncbi:Centrosomal protein of 192 kDa [Geodia barretti]|uniref:Centrosomal protein of 192 kDa n=1 Tax=Geodia barretti TaxID=519541 RepID=A0AA35TNM5_GEOBA|nr:Centrosomal protein of 192 kDa [Geodia barretti]
MSRGKVGPRPVMDTTLLSASAIGSPAAFSTAIKPPGSFNTHHSDGDASLLAHQPHEVSRLLSDNVAGQLSLSLSSEHPRTEGAVADETSFGILDLDNLHESSMSVFLTSPRTSRDLMGSNLPLAVSSTSRALTSTSQLPLSPPASMGPLRLSGTTGFVGGSHVVEQDGGGEEGREGEREVGLPEDLLEVSSSVGYSSDAEEEGEMMGRRGENLNPVERDSEHSDQVRLTGDGHEKRSLEQHLPLLPPVSPRGERSGEVEGDRGGGGGGVFSVSEILQEAQRGGEDRRTSHRFLATTHSLITDQEEPSAMRRAAEFGNRLQPPDQVSSRVEREDLSQRSAPVASGGDKTRRTTLPPLAGQSITSSGTANTTVTLPNSAGGSTRGLPSAYLHQSSVHSSASPHTVSRTPSGTPDSSPPLSPRPPPPIPTSLSPLATGDNQRYSARGEAGEEARNSLYNPFDSEDVVGEVVMGDEEFGGGMDSDSFVAQLRADEAALEEANKFLLPAEFVASTPQTPSFTHLSSTSLPPSSLPPSLPRSGERELSVGEYFGRRSYKMGALEGSGALSSSERPQFSWLSSTQSSQPTPPSEGREPQASQSTAPKASPEDADTTLVASEDGQLGEDDEPASHPHHPHNSGSDLAKIGGVPVSSVQTRSSSNTTPSVPPKLRPATYQIPKLDLSGLSKTINATPTVTSSTTGHKLTLPSSISASTTPLSTSHSLAAAAKSLPTPVPTVASITSSKRTSLTPTTVASASLFTPGMESGLQHSGMDSGLSSGMEHRLESRYWRPSSGTSTLLFPELSATSLSPPPTDIAGLSSMPTPSIAHLSGGFNATSASEVPNFLDSLLGSLPVPSSVGRLSLSGGPGKIPGVSLHSPPVSKTVGGGVTSAQVTGASTASNSPRISSNSTSLESGNAEKNDERQSPLVSLASSSSKTPPDLKASEKKKKSRLESPPGSGSASKDYLVDSVHHSVGSPGEAGSPVRQRPPSPRTETARKKISQLKAALDATEFDAAAFLSRLEGEKGSSVAQPLSLTTGTSVSMAPAATQPSTSLNQSPPNTSGTSLQSPVVGQTLTNVDHLSLTTASHGTTTTVSTTTTTVNQTTTVVGQSADTMVNPTNTVVDQTTTFAHVPSKMLSQPSIAISSTATSSALPAISTGRNLPHASPSPPKPSISSPLPVSMLGQTSTANVSVSSNTSSTSSGALNLEDDCGGSPESEVEGKARKRGERKRPRQPQSVAVRDIGVGTTPSLHRTQTRSGSHIHTSRSLDESLVNITQPVSASIVSHAAPLSPSTSPQRKATRSSPLSPPSSSLVSPLRNTREQSSSSQPIYTSPRLLPHTSLSPPPQPHPQPLTGRERRKTPQPNSLRVPDSLIFKTPCCVGVTLPDHLQISNVGDRWLQLNFELGELYRNGTLETDLSSFSFPQRCFVSPRKTESIKIGFSPKQAGSYEAVLVCRARLVVSSEGDSSNFIQESVVVKALAVPPLLEVATPSTSSEETCLDYGLLTTGTSLSLPLHLTNLGSSELPLRLAIAAPTLSQLYFSFDDPPPSLKTPSSSPSSYLHPRPFSTTFILPPKPLGRDIKPETYLLSVNFKSPKNFADDSTLLGSPEEIKAQVNVSVEGPNSTGVLYSVPVRVTVGVARLHVPRSLQALSFSCCEGQTITRDVPFKNGGNIPLQIALEFSTECKHFRVTPDFLELSPSEEAQIKVSFSPHSSPLLINGRLMVHVPPHGPSYELKVQGTALEREETDKRYENLLFCSKRCLYWGGVEVGDTAEQTLLLQNSFSSAVPLQFSIRHQNQGFQLEVELNLLFSPPSTAVFRNALDIFDALHSKKFRIPLCGYGGTSRIEIINVRRSTSGGVWVDIGPVAVQTESTVKISLYNSGSRAGFVKALVLPVDEEEEAATDKGTECHVQTLLRRRGGKCLEGTAPLARLVFVHGDEIIRQRFQRALRQGVKKEKRRRRKRRGKEDWGTHSATSSTRISCLSHLEQESVESELDFAQFEVENEERFFEQQIQQIEVALCGSQAPCPPALREKTQRQPLSMSFDTPPRTLKMATSPSHSPSKTTPPPAGTVSLSTWIISSLTLLFPDTTSGQRSEKMLDVHNPYSQSLQWKLSSVASPFVRDAAGSSSSICKANYSVFWVHERKGTVAPTSSAQVLVMFQPHDVGSFSQIWDLQVFGKELENGSKKIRLSFGGKAVGKRSRAEQAPRVRFTSPPPSPLHPTKPPSPSLTTGTSSHPPTLTTGTSSHSPPTLTTGTTKRAVYIKEETVQFPSTEVGSETSVKVKVCNRDKCQHQFQVVSLSPPFTIEHHSFLLGPRQCARLPVCFTPTRPGVFEAVLAVRTATGHQAFSQLTGTAIAHEYSL